MEYLEVRDKIKITFLIFLIVFALIFFENINGIYHSIEDYFIKIGTLNSFFLFSLIVILAIVLTPIPYSPFAVIAGAVFGPWLGILVSLFSIAIGAVIAFLIGRHFLHNFFWKKFKKNKIYRKMLEEEHKSLLKFIFISRLMPQAPFDIVSYFAGITTLKIWKFALATILGMIPVVLILSLFGSALEYYRITALSIIIIAWISFSIYKIIRYKRYYVKGY